MAPQGRIFPVGETFGKFKEVARQKPENGGVMQVPDVQPRGEALPRPQAFEAGSARDRGGKKDDRRQAKAQQRRKRSPQAREIIHAGRDPSS